MSGQAMRMFHRIFVTNLPWTVSHKELAEYFCRFGTVSKSRVIFDKSTGMNRGYGFIEFANKADFDNAMNNKEHLLEGSYIVVQPATNQ